MNALAADAVWHRDLRRYQDTLRTPEKRRKKEAWVASMFGSEDARRLAEEQLDLWLGYFLWCERELRKLIADPQLIDRFVLDLRESGRYFTLEEWPRLHRILAEAETIANRTRSIRIAIALGAHRRLTSAPV